MPTEMKGRRVPVVVEVDPVSVVTEPGDYWGPVYGYTGRKKEDGTLEPLLVVVFLLPIARDSTSLPSEARSLHSVCSPPHVFIEEPDGSLTIRESIGAGRPYYWHGYLTEGRWELNKSK